MDLILQNFFSSARLLAEYRRDSSSIFIPLIMKYKKNKLLNRQKRIIKNMILNKDALIEFCSIYGTNFDRIMFDGLTSYIQDNHFNFIIKKDDDMKIYLSCFDQFNRNRIYICIDINDKHDKWTVNDKLEYMGSIEKYKLSTDMINDIMKDFIIMYLKMYLKEI